jgi:predicted 3-demethylubiquinone-9 3-methyltransferase (glyoxalase superfamily)
MSKISTWLWFDNEAEEAARFYASVFRKARLGDVIRAPGGAEPYTKEGQVLVAEVFIDGHQICCLNGGNNPEAKPNDAVSFQILCDDQAEVDQYWDRLAAGGEEKQIVPEILPRISFGPDREAARRVTEAMMKMVKLDVAALQAAADNE